MEKAIRRRRSQPERRRSAPARTIRTGSWPTRAFLLASLVLGGAGSSSPLANWLIVLLGLVVLAQRLPSLSWAALDAQARRATWLLVATIGLCVVQTIPLPRGVWAGLPGHGLAAQIAAASGGSVWSAWSLAPDRTLEALTALIPIMAAGLIAAQADAEERLALLRLVVVVALVGAVLAVIQLGAGPGSAPVVAETLHRGFGVGFFVNRNHFALFELVAMQIVALPGVPAVLRKVENPRAAEWGLRSGALALLALGVLSSLSRAGITLLPVALVAAILIGRQGRVRVPVLIGGIAVGALIALALRSAPPVQQLLARFAQTADDKRFQYWVNTLDAVRDALPLGTGLGTFTLIYPSYEPLNEVYPLIVNHAHNDFLELALETGVPGVLLLLAWLGVVTIAVLAARKHASSRRERLLPLAAALAVMLTLAASVVDYPMRMHAVAVTLALLVGMLTRVVKAAEPLARPTWPRRALVWSPLVLLGLFTTSGQWGQLLAGRDQEPWAARVAPWSSQVQAAAATYFELRGQTQASAGAAHRALALSPLNAPAVRAEGLAALALGPRERGAAMMSLAANLGWRDALTQLWLIEQALAANAHGFAVQRIDGLLRQDKLSAELIPLLPPLMATADGRAALAEQLAFHPGWRTAFFNEVARQRTWTMPQLFDLAERLRRAKAPLQPVDTALMRGFLAIDGRYQDARRLWRASGETTEVGDGEFTSHPGALPGWNGPYGWYAPPLAGVRVDIAVADMLRKGQALAITSNGLAAGPALAQPLVLPAGRHVLALSARSDEAALLDQVAVTLTCTQRAGQRSGAPIPLTLGWQRGPGDWRRGEASFAVPPQCPGQLLELSVPQTGGRHYSLWLDGVSIRSATLPGA